MVTGCCNIKRNSKIKWTSHVKQLFSHKTVKLINKTEIRNKKEKWGY